MKEEKFGNKKTIQEDLNEALEYLDESRYNFAQFVSCFGRFYEDFKKEMKNESK